MYKIMIIGIFKYLFNNTLGTGFCAVNLISIVACQYLISVLADSPPMSRHWPQVEWHQGVSAGLWLVTEMAWVPSSGCHEPWPGDTSLCLFWKLWPGIAWWERDGAGAALSDPHVSSGRRGGGDNRESCKVLQASQSKQIQHQRGTFGKIIYWFMTFFVMSTFFH